MPQDTQGQEINAAALPNSKPIKPIRKLRHRASGAGRPSTLTEDKILEIRAEALRGTNEAEIIRKLNIPQSTWYFWKAQNTGGIEDKLTTWRREHLLKRAEEVLQESLNSKAERIKLDASTFITETLGRAIFHKKAETEQNLLLPVQLVINAPNGQPLQLDTPVQVQSTPVAESTPITQPEGNNEGVESE